MTPSYCIPPMSMFIFLFMILFSTWLAEPQESHDSILLHPTDVNVYFFIHDTFLKVTINRLRTMASIGQSLSGSKIIFSNGMWHLEFGMQGPLDTGLSI